MLNCGFSDPYLNTDAGTISPFEHGEVFVLDDGGEVRGFPFGYNPPLSHMRFTFLLHRLINVLHFLLSGWLHLLVH